MAGGGSVDGGLDGVRIAHLAKENKASLHEVLESEGVIAEKDLALLLATSLGLRVIDLSSFALDKLRLDSERLITLTTVFFTNYLALFSSKGKVIFNSLHLS